MARCGWLVFWVLTALVALGLERPNVVMVVVDDLGYADLSCMDGADDVATPNIDRLATRGVIYRNAYATAPICNASRIAILTGCYQQRQGQFWYSGPGLHDKGIATIPELLRRVGYATGFVGKFHHGKSDRPGQRGFPLAHGFDSCFGFAGGTKHYLRHKSAYTGKGDMLHQGPMWDGDQARDVDGFATEVFGEKARSFVAANREKPFYLHLAFSAVHNFTHQLPEEYLKKHNLPPFPEAEAKTNYWGWRQKLGYPAHPHGRDYYLGQLHYLDKEVGLLLDQLEELGLREKTAVFFVSDNGGSLVTYADNGALRGGKYTLLEGGTRVPMIMQLPWRKPAAATSDALASTLDLLPTVCELTGAVAPGDVDGQSLLAEAEARDLYWDTQSQEAIRSGKWKLLVTKRTPNARLQIEATPKGTFLYDVTADPGEARDLSAASPEVVAELRKRLDAWRERGYLAH